MCFVKRETGTLCVVKRESGTFCVVKRGVLSTVCLKGAGGRTVCN